MRLVLSIDEELPLNERYRKLAHLLGISQKEIGESIGTNPVLVSRILTGRDKAGPTMRRIADYIDRRIAERDDVEYLEAA